MKIGTCIDNYVNRKREKMEELMNGRCAKINQDKKIDDKGKVSQRKRRLKDADGKLP